MTRTFSLSDETLTPGEKLATEGGQNAIIAAIQAGGGGTADIVGINGVAPSVGAGSSDTGTLRVAVATDDVNLSAIKTALELIDDWDESDRAKVNIIAGQAGVQAGAGAVSANTLRTTLASDDPAVAALQIMDDWDNAASDGASVSGDVAHGSADAGEPVKIGFKSASATSLPTATTVGDRTNLAGSTQGEIYVYNTRLQWGEDEANELTAIGHKRISGATFAATKDVSSALEASSISKASAGNLYGAYGVIDSSASTDIYYIQFLDSASLPAEGTVTHIVTPIVVNHTNGTDSRFELPALFLQNPARGANGIVIVVSTTLVTKTIAGSIMFATVLYE